jgi:hypothetical protein
MMTAAHVRKFYQTSEFLGMAMLVVSFEAAARISMECQQQVKK